MTEVATVRDESTGVTVGVPPLWHQVHQEPDEVGFAPLVLTPKEWPADYGFRPSITMIASPPADPPPSVHEAGTEAVAAAMALPDTRVLAYEVWAQPEGRHLVFAYLTGQTAVVVSQVIFNHRQRTVTVTASVDTDRYPRVSNEFAYAFAGLSTFEGKADDA
jgi:hypothetical protein